MVESGVIAHALLGGWDLIDFIEYESESSEIKGGVWMLRPLVSAVRMQVKVEVDCITSKECLVIKVTFSISVLTKR